MSDKKKKIYVSKSNKANPDLIRSVNKSLEENFGNDVEVIVFGGGGQDAYKAFWAEHKDSIDLVVCIGPNVVSHSNGEARVYMGKGNYSECTTAPNAIVRVVALEKDADPLEWRELMCIDKPTFVETEENWQNSWGYCTGELDLLF